ncbi:hypothetical protein OG758_20825 [Streptomyces sp. NBC_01474]|uniref:hypothetical protein n=1 Tax=Streptomyces sp. NBC_01474 TaxID=2903880 RepID=UPI002DD847D4|nr:hypothetical protein [Streptomyces sp. NBC_01474]WSD96374.1 hypothetical protein OG758_20825 [Streptomyces sp. NBC_01474]
MLDHAVRFLAWVLRLCSPPPRGRHRLGIRTSPLAPPPPSHTERLDGAASALVRPYVLTPDERHRQRERRRTLHLATLGVDVGPHPHLIHGGAR